MITDTCKFVYEHHAGGDLSQTYIGRGVVDAIPTPSAVLSQFSEDDLLRNTYSLAEILMCHPSLRIIWHCHGNLVSKFDILTHPNVVFLHIILRLFSFY